MFEKRLMLLFFIGLLSLAMVSTVVSAVEVGISRPFGKADRFGTVVFIRDASSVYGYEINLDFTNSIEQIDHFQYLSINSTASYGYTTRDNLLSVYGSQTNSTRPGVSGDGDLFEITYDGEISLNSITIVYSNGSTEEVSFLTSPPTHSEGSIYETSGSGGGGAVTTPPTTTPEDGPISPTVEDRPDRFTDEDIPVGDTPDDTTSESLGYYLLIIVPVAVAIVGFIGYLIVHRFRTRPSYN